LKSGIKIALVVTTAMLVTGGLPILIPMWCDHRAVEQGHGQVKWAAWVGSGSTAGLLTAEEIELSEGPDALRLSVLDPATGALRARRVLDEPGASCRSAAADRVWCRIGQRVHLLGAVTLGDLTTEDDLILHSALLKVGLSTFTPQVDPNSGELVVGTNDGLRVAIDPLGLRTRQVSEKTDFPSIDSVPDGELYSLEVGEFSVRPEGDAQTDRQVLVRRSKEGGPEVQLGLDMEAAATPGAAGVPRGSYLKAKFLEIQDGAGDRRFLFTDPPGFILLHQSSLDDQQAKRLVSRLDLDGKLRWTLERPCATVIAGFRTQGRLILVFGDPQNEAQAVDLLDGATGWTFQY
jgi:hypothetical protein